MTLNTEIIQKIRISNKQVKKSQNNKNLLVYNHKKWYKSKKLTHDNCTNIIKQLL